MPRLYSVAPATLLITAEFTRYRVRVGVDVTVRSAPLAGDLPVVL